LHVPFSKMESVKDQRFSLSGCPALYLGSSIFDCWEELDRPQWERMFVSCFKLEKPLKTCDLRFREACSKEDRKPFLPFIIASSFRVMSKDKNVFFKPEYIIPKILSEYIMLHKFNGLVYQSVMVSEDFDYNKDLLDNYMFFVKRSKTYDKSLIGKFSISAPSCYAFEEIKGTFNKPIEIYYDFNPEHDRYRQTLMDKMETILRSRTNNE